MYESLPEEIKKLKQWVCARDDHKCPMICTEFKAASSSNPNTWSDFATACQSVKDGLYDHIGFVFDDNGIVGIDIDKGFDEDGLLSDLSIDCMQKCESYTELSKSGRGIHILVKGSLPFMGRNNQNGIEIYRDSRYFICTGKNLIYKDLVENQEAINYIVDKYFKVEEKEGCKGNALYHIKYKEPKDGKVFIKPYYPKIGDGGRNISLTSIGGMMHTIGYSYNQIYNELMMVNKTACIPPLPTDEVETIIQSVTRYKR